MTISDILAKLGILRYGAKAATYHSATDRPAELQIDGVFDARRDLIDIGDLRKKLQSKPDAKTRPGRN